MQKKLLAAAVAGALGIPAVALAQNATVNVYGRIYMEYGFTNTGTAWDRTNTAAGVPVQVNRINPDALQAPGSEIGFRGEEKLGGGLSAWFQCASTADVRGGVDGWCSRNSAVGLKGGFGNFFIGNWHTPFTRARITPGGNETGNFGTAGLLTGHSTTVADGGGPQLFARRQNNLITYDTPNFGGLTVSGAWTSINTTTNDLQGSIKPRVWSVAGIYNNGPIAASLAYEKHSQFYAGANFKGDESGILAGFAYNIGGKINVGGLFTEQKWELAPGTNGKVRAWQIGVDANIVGPHSVLAAYTKANDVKGNSAAGALRPASGGDTGAWMAQVRYKLALSKRTDVGAGYNYVKNDRNAGYNINGIGSNGGAGGTLGFGAKNSTIAMFVDHRF